MQQTQLAKLAWSVAATLALSGSGSGSHAAVIPSAEKRFAAADAQEVPSLQRHVLPLMGRLGCNGGACHGSFQGQGGFRLSLFGYDFKMDHDALTTGAAPRVNLKSPRESLVLEKPTATDKDEHGGGHKLDVDSWQYRVLLRWIEAGATAVNEEKEAHFVRLEVSPLEIVFKKPGEKAQLKVISHWSDGTSEDVTPLCRFTTNDDAVAKVSVGGEVSILTKGDTHIVAFYDNGVVPVSVLLPVSDQVGPKFPSVPTPTKIDELVVNKLRKLGIVPSGVCTDAEFLRRTSLDITGTLPSADEVKAFLADTSPNKRTAKIDELLERPAYAAWWSTKLCDVLGNGEGQFRTRGKVGSPNAQWYYWLNKRVGENMHYDDLIEKIVLAKSRENNEDFLAYCTEMTNLAHDDSKFAGREFMPHYWARLNMRKSNEKALSFSYALLGVRLQCAECHKHPFDQWSQTDFQQFTAFFEKVNYGVADRKESEAMLAALGLDKKLPNNEKDKLIAKALAEGRPVPFDELIIRKTGGGKRKDGDNGNKQMVAGRVITPKVLGGDELLDANYDDPRQPLMDWLRQKDNPYFARAFVNRVWASYFNIGIVEPPDDVNLANAPSNKELLDTLADDFIAHDYDMKWLHRTIAGSRTYQLGWQTNATNEFDLRNYSHAVPRRLPAEVVYDAVVSATAGKTELTQRQQEPTELCSIGLAKGYTVRAGQGNGKGSNYALSVFGKPKRETPCDCERSNEPSLLQTVYLHNDQEVFGMMDRGNGWLQNVVRRLPAASSSVAKPLSELEQQQARLAELTGKLDKVNSDKDAAKGIREEIRQVEAKIRKLSRTNDTASSGEPKTPLTTDEAIREAYLRTFSRYPLPQEIANAQKYIAESTDASAGLHDLVWALLNAKEFLVNH